jgi:Acetyltransferase (isoleucine patch superfamily)
MDRTIWDELDAGEGVGKSTPGIEEFDACIKECEDLRMAYNTTVMTRDEQRTLLSKMVGYEVDEKTFIVPPFHCDLGFNIILGKNVLINYDCVLLDCTKIIIGDNVLIGPGTKIVTASHPMDINERRERITVCHPVKIGNDVWIGAGAVILPGITIGDRSVVGAGSIVTRDVPSNTIVAGNPARKLRSL